MRIVWPDQAEAVLDNAASILGREIRMRHGINLPIVGGLAGPGDIELAVVSGLAAEKFYIKVGEQGGVQIASGSPAGVVFGCGKLLRTMEVLGSRLIFKATSSTELPKNSFRGIYFATHFHNFYHNAPLAEIKEYLNSLALWGINTLIVWFDRHHFKGIHDPATQVELERLKAMFTFARAVGMKTGLTMLGNEGYKNSPEWLRAEVGKIRTCPYGVELCPSKPGSLELLAKETAELLSQFDSLDYLMAWPYDQGGCDCDRCRPWGANGFLRCAERISGVFRTHSPKGKFILSTWLFDFPGNVTQHGEWDGLLSKLENDLPWIDMLLADGHDKFPLPPLQREIPRKVPLVNFPEISMLRMIPWGGYGINPLPRHWQEMWDLVGSRIKGSLPYSEGIFEDLNKVVWAQLNWNANRSVHEIMREYAAYEFSSKHADSIVRAMELMENTHSRRFDPDREDILVELANSQEVDEIWDVISQVDGELSGFVREGWRWRLTYLRAWIDKQLKASGGRMNSGLVDAFDEIWRKYYAERKSWKNLRPIRPGIFGGSMND